MATTYDLEEEAAAADALAEHLLRIEAPQELVDQARQQAAELRSKQRERTKAPSGAATASTG